PGLVIADRAAFLRVVVGGEAFAHFPFAERKAVPQHIAERLFRRTLGVAREPFQAALLGEVEHEWPHQEKSITRRAFSARTKAPNSCGVLPTGSAPSAARRSRAARRRIHRATHRIRRMRHRLRAACLTQK